MGGRIRRGLLVVGSAIANVANMNWTDNHEFDRSKADTEMHGIPVQMSEGGTGTLELLAGNIVSGYQTSDWVYTYKQITQTGGVESVTDKTVTFKHVTVTSGGSMPGEGRGARNVSFEYGEIVDAV